MFYENAEFYNIAIIRKYGGNIRYMEMQKYEDLITFTPGADVIKLRKSVFRKKPERFI